MNKDNKQNLTSQQRLLNELKKDLTDQKYIQPRMYKDNLDYFQRMATLTS